MRTCLFCLVGLRIFALCIVEDNVKVSGGRSNFKVLPLDRAKQQG